MRIAHTRVCVFAVLFAAFVVLDGIKFLIAGKPTIVDWETFVHPAWVIVAGITLLVAAFYPSAQRAAFWVYLLVFIASYVNVYLAFTEVLTYFCMIFNLVLTAVFFFAQRST